MYFLQNDFANHFFPTTCKPYYFELTLVRADHDFLFHPGPRFQIFLGPWSAFSKILLVRVRSGPRTRTDRFVRADQLFGPWIPGSKYPTFQISNSNIFEIQRARGAKIHS